MWTWEAESAKDVRRIRSMATFAIVEEPESEVWQRVASVGPRTVSRMKSLGQ